MTSPLEKLLKVNKGVLKQKALSQAEVDGPKKKVVIGVVGLQNQSDADPIGPCLAL